MNSKINTVIVTNVPAPYRVPGWQLVAEISDINLNIIYCAKSTIDPTLDSNSIGFSSFFLQGKLREYGIRFLHSDIRIWKLLTKLQPDVVITTGFIPTYLFAFAWAIFHRVPHIAMSDGTIHSEKSLSFIHRILRRIVYSFSAAFVGASEGSLALFRSYGIASNKLHQSPLCTHNNNFNQQTCKREIDFLFSGRFIDLKNPIFAIQVASATAKIMGRKLTLDILGQGEMEQELRTLAHSVKDLVSVRFLGYLAQQELPEVFAKARVFLFPSKFDCWGLVANEACASGMPVLISPHAGAADELVKEGVNGYIMELDAEIWSRAAARLLSDEVLYTQFSRQSKELVSAYSFENAASGLAAAIRQAAA
ncbi:MAG: glycosyltransferase family 4 protein [Rhodoferax sp.]|nr:glycosyltransferase family 4 protein [Rhodoferax sp.]